MFETTLQNAVLKHPILTGLALMTVALVFRLGDIFVLRLDERWGEIMLSKALGFGLVVFFIWATGRRLADIGLHTTWLGQSVVLGTLVAMIALIAGYGVEFLVQHQSGARPAFRLAAIDPKAGVAGGLLFAAWLLLGNVVNSFMEEGLFRGAMGRLFLIRLSFWQVNLLQAFLFGLWHLVWAVKWYQTGQMQTPGEVLFGVVGNFLPQFLLGLVWGYLFLKTGNLWAAWTAHTLTNTALNFLHIATAEGLDSGISIRMAVYCAIAMLGMFLVKLLAEQWQMPVVAPWCKRYSPQLI